MTDLIERLRKRSTAVYLATEEGPAKDISDHLREAADELERLQEDATRLAATVSDFAKTNAKLQAELERLQKQSENYERRLNVRNDLLDARKEAITMLERQVLEYPKLKAIAEAAEGCFFTLLDGVVRMTQSDWDEVVDALAAWREK